MGSRDKDSKSLQDKLKHYFRKSSGGSGNTRSEVSVCAETERELGPAAAAPRRLRAARDLSDRLAGARLQTVGVERLWMCVRDLAEGAAGAEGRTAALGLMARALEAAGAGTGAGAGAGGGAGGGVVRTALFRHVRAAAPPLAPSFPPLYRLLHALTNHGRDLTAFEEQMGQLILEWFPELVTSPHVVEFMQLVTNVVKFNAAYLDEDVVQGIVYHASVVVVCECAAGGAARGAEAGGEGEAEAGGGAGGGALALLEACVAYSLVPRGALAALCAAVSRAVCDGRFTRASWKVLRMVAGGAGGAAALAELVRLVEGGGDVTLVRGAVFHVHMALWGARRPPQLPARVSHLAVLPAFLRALAPPAHPALVYEILLAAQSLLQRSHPELHEPAWDLLLDILTTVNEHNKSSEPPNDLIHSVFHAVLTQVEQLLDKQQYFGDVERLHRLFDACLLDRPESSAIRWVRWSISRAAEEAADGGCEELAALAERHARRDPRRAVRLRALQELHDALLNHALAHADEAWWRAAAAAASADAGVPERAAAARLAAALLVAAPPDPLPPPYAAAAAADLLHNLERIANRAAEGAEGEAEAGAEDVAAGVAGLASVVRARLCRAPPLLPARALVALLDHLELAYRRTPPARAAPQAAALAACRDQIFDLIFSLRVNAYGCIGLVYETAGGGTGSTGGSAGSGVGGAAAINTQHRPVYSPYLFIDPLPKSSLSQPPIAREQCGAMVCSVRVWRALGGLVAREGAWRVWCAGVARLPPALPPPPPELDRLATALCACVAQRPPPHPEHAPRALAALSRLAPHHARLDPNTHHRILRTILKYGVVLREPVSQQCLPALTLFTLETRDTMVRMLPEVLLDLSKISDTKAIAGPMLEFLSTLTRLPRVFASFVEDQYMSVFAVLLPYTNPSRYHHYTVSLAHHVLAAWFLKCRLSYRRNFVRFIIHGLHNYTIKPFEEQLFKSGSFQQPPGNEDSTNRKRSSSLGSKNVSGGAGGRGAGGAGGAADSSALFHLELTEACVDLLARYTFSPCSVRPARSPTAAFLLAGGHSATWLVGHRLVTVTVSGCHRHAPSQPLCDRCASLCRLHAESAASPQPRAPASPAPAPTPVPAPAPAPPDDDGQNENSSQNQSSNTNQLQVNTTQGSTEIRRYSKVSLQRSGSTDTAASSLSVDAGRASAEPAPSRQNSSESRSEWSASAEAALAQRLDKLTREIEAEEAWGVGSGGGGGAGAGSACACWCAGWAEVHVRAPAGDTAWMLRTENQMCGGAEWADTVLHDIAGLLAPSLAPPAPAAAAPAPAAHAAASQSLNVSEGELRSRSGSSAARTSSMESEGGTGTSVGGVSPQRAGGGGGGRAPHSTSPINIPTAAAAHSPTDDDSKSRHPVRRSNSSPEMSSSWKLQAAAAAAEAEGAGAGAEVGERDDAPPPRAAPPGLGAMILLPSCEPTAGAGAGGGGGVKKARGGGGGAWGETRVSCEAIPEEMCGGSPRAAAPAFPAAAPPPAPAPPHAEGAEEAGARGGAPLQKAASAGGEGEELPPLARSKRSNTISVMSPTRRKRETSSPRGGRSGSSSSSSGGGGGGAAGGSGGSSGGGGGGGVTPAFVLLQLYANMTARAGGGAGGAGLESPARPLRVLGAQHERTVKNLDLTPPIDTYKVGVLYVGAGQQDSELAILRNEHGSQRYSVFLSGLGSVVDLMGGGSESDLQFLSLERGGRDGAYTYVWSDDIMQVQYHVGTAMPTLPEDPSCNEKRKHIGNDLVCIIYNDSGAPFSLHTLKGQLITCCVEVEPVGGECVRVSLRTRDETIRTKYLAHCEPQLCSDRSAPLLARQLALHASLAARVSHSLQLSGGAAHASNALERLRIIKRLRARLQAERDARPYAPYAPPPPASDPRHIHIDDFTDYT